jgi:hypothetical protein
MCEACRRGWRPQQGQNGRTVRAGLAVETKNARKGNPIGKWSGSDATRELHETIKTFNAETSRQTRTLIRLTWIIAALTFVMAIEVAWQLWKGAA